MSNKEVKIGQKKGLQNNPLVEKTSRQKRVITVSQKPVKCTYYLSPRTVEKIEKIRYDLLSKHKFKISRSRIMEIAVKIVDDDLTAKQSDGLLVKHISVT